MPSKTPAWLSAAATATGNLAAKYLRQFYWFVKRTNNWKLGAMGIGSLLFIIVLTVSFFYLRALSGAYGNMPDLAELALVENDEASSIISEDGVTLAKYYQENRLSVPLEAISPYVTKALIATEDSRFFEHQGIDVRALGRVLVYSIALRSSSSGGGSTISQQLAKQLYPRQNNGSLSILKTKIREMMIASRLEKVYTKQELLALYLNTVPFGENAYGIEVAATRFFDKSAVDLKAEEAAVLVGLLKANTTYSPRAHPVKSRQRRDVVLGLMAKNGSLTQGETDSLRTLDLVTDYRRYNEAVGSAPHFREQLRQEVERALAGKTHPDSRPYNVDLDGLKIHVSINSDLQRFAEQAVREELPKIQASLAADWQGQKNLPWENAFKNAVKRSDRYKNLAAAGVSEADIEAIMSQARRMTVYDPQNVAAVDTTLSSLDSLRHYFTLLNAGLLVTQGRDGVVRAWVGGVDHRFVQYDHVRARRQVGSTIKPVIYATALQEGMQPCEYTPAEQFTITEFQNYNPGNANGSYDGVYSMRGGLSKSVNTVAVNIAVRSGLSRVAAAVKAMGVDGKVEAIPSLALGTVEASLPEMNTVYSSFANGGVRPAGIHFLDKITTYDGTVIVEFKRPTATQKVMDRQTAAVATYLLEGVVNDGTGAKLRGTYGLAGPLAGKTGTTQDQSDGWFIGFTPKLVVSTWVGAEYPIVHFRSLRRGSATATALPIWGNFMRKVQQAPGLQFYKGGAFTPMDEMALALVRCPDYLDEMPILFAGEDGVQNASAILGDFLGQDIEEMMARKRQRNDETPREYAERIAKYLEKEQDKDERRKKRKEFWSDRLFNGGQDER
ncbi:transglycosylase domain-containing protein [Neolewinella antarctica]|uniref:Penicillin-binding protein 1A n=1 Tax=Neolewinella antarctica TaxID=442734 RepID=A0ABX0XGD7_9BACT|nr:transglycosylase domain-containing protein [Neolewinella antarctica]NJC27979.1 penicillin-binding protein 1A [Neolewinella antarctica]